MSKIKALLSKNSNYIYHMLSVAKCGYDNTYGDRYGEYHSQTDLQILKKWEKLISVSGGEHCGELYGICIGIPASFDDDIIQAYFSALLDLFKIGNTESNFTQYKRIYEIAFSSFNIPINQTAYNEFYESCISLKTAITEISSVLLDNYPIYSEQIWETTKKELTETIDQLNLIFSQNDYVLEWEKELGCKYKYDYFYAVICNGIEDGPQAIDISHNKDIFNLSDDTLASVALINHEFGIYLLKDVLADTRAFKDFSCYSIIESLAEFFNQRITDGHSHYMWNNEYIHYYQSLRRNNPRISVTEMFLEAEKAFI